MQSTATDQQLRLLLAPDLFLFQPSIIDNCKHVLSFVNHTSKDLSTLRHKVKDQAFKDKNKDKEWIHNDKESPSQLPGNTLRNLDLWPFHLENSFIRCLAINLSNQIWEA